MDATLEPSATVLILRDAPLEPTGCPESAPGLEVLLVQRHHAIRVGGGSWVFPGGRIDSEEQRAATDPLEAARQAAVREVAEETGLRITPEQLIPFAHWTTPPGPPRRFATYFFAAQVSPNESIQVDGSEIVDHRWLSPRDALDARQRGELNFMPPAFVCLHRLLAHSTSDSALSAFASRPLEHFNPRMVETDTGRVILYDDDCGFANGDIHAEGLRHRLEVCGEEWIYVFETRDERRQM